MLIWDRSPEDELEATVTANSPPPLSLSLLMEKYVILIPCVVERGCRRLHSTFEGFLFEKDPESKHQAVHELDKKASCILEEEKEKEKCGVVKAPRRVEQLLSKNSFFNLGILRKYKQQQSLSHKSLSASPHYSKGLGSQKGNPADYLTLTVMLEPLVTFAGVKCREREQISQVVVGACKL